MTGKIDLARTIRIASSHGILLKASAHANSDLNQCGQCGRQCTIRYLQTLPLPEKEKIKSALTQLAADPFGYPGIKAMAGQWVGYHRIRLSNKRVIYWLDQQEKVLFVDHIGPRGDVYT